jgi:homoserine kinase type II
VGAFTVVGESELSMLADTFGLGALRSHRTIAAGTINSNFEIVTDRGRYFLRINEGKAEADVAWESRLVLALARDGVAAPAPLLAADGRPYAPLRGPPTKWVSVFPWRDGVHLAPDDVTLDRARTFGSALAELHRAGLALPASWRRGSIYDHDHLVMRYDHVSRSSDPALGHAIELLGEELDVAADAAPIRRAATHGIIHGDLFRDNVLWQGERIAAILDFEQASGGSLAYDIAVCINDWCWTPARGEAIAPPGANAGGAPRVDLATSLVAGYQTIRALTDSDREALPFEIRAAATRFTITRITDVYLARLANPEKDFRAFLARVEAWRGPALGQLTGTL